MNLGFICLLMDLFASELVTLCFPSFSDSPHPGSFMPPMMYQLPLQQASQRPSVSSSSSVLATPAAGPQTTAPSPVQVVHDSSALFASVPTRPLHISPITLPTGNHQVGSDIRAPAPHLQPFRPAIPPSLVRGMPSQQALTNKPPSTSCSLPQVQHPQQQQLLPARLPLSSYQTCQQQQQSSGQRPENQGGGLPLNNPPQSLMELLMDVDNRIGPNNPWSVLPPPASVAATSNLVTSEPRTQDAGLTSAVVCLSDDD